MKNKPVAYISKNGVLFKELPPEGIDLQPLYTHPVSLVDTDSEEAFIKWQKTQMFPISDVEQHGFVNGFKWAIEEAQK